MIVRERADSFVLVKQHDHALASGEFAEHWAQRPYPFESTLRAVANHDIAWQALDTSVRWNEEADRPYAFTDYPPKPKVAAYAAGIDLLEKEDPYAACLCSMHYEALVRDFGRSEAEARFAEAEAERQRRLREGMNGEEEGSLERNLEFLRLCDGLSLFVCLNEPGQEGRPPPYPGGFEFDGKVFEPVWRDEYTLSFDPYPFSGSFDLSIPYRLLGKDRRFLGGGALSFRVIR